MFVYLLTTHIHLNLTDTFSFRSTEPNRGVKGGSERQKAPTQHVHYYPVPVPYQTPSWTNVQPSQPGWAPAPPPNWTPPPTPGWIPAPYPGWTPTPPGWVPTQPPNWMASAPPASYQWPPRGGFY
jgi:hypothetical protein